MEAINVTLAVIFIVIFVAAFDKTRLESVRPGDTPVSGQRFETCLSERAF
jgi:hypothetical protein